MKYLIALFALLFSLESRAEWNDWDDTDKKLFVTQNILIAADWMTTRYGAKHRAELPGTYETNPILGKFPSTQKIDLYFIGVMIGNYYFADWLGSSDRKFFLIISSGLEAMTVKHNIGIGWKLAF